MSLDAAFANIRTFSAAVAAVLALAGCGTGVSATPRPALARGTAVARAAAGPSRADGLPSAPVEAVRPGGTLAAEPDPDAEARRQIVGKWKQLNTGVRYLALRPDGTGTMVIDPDWIAKAIIGDRLTIVMEWSIADGHALMKSVSGDPPSAFKTVSSLFGRDRNRLIETLDAETFVLYDEADKSRSVWTRIPEGETLPPAIAE